MPWWHHSALDLSLLHGCQGHGEFNLDFIMTSLSQQSSFRVGSVKHFALDKYVLLQYLEVPTLVCFHSFYPSNPHSWCDPATHGARWLTSWDPWSWKESRRILGRVATKLYLKLSLLEPLARSYMYLFAKTSG